jgi:hypothetical protein
MAAARALLAFRRCNPGEEEDAETGALLLAEGLAALRTIAAREPL